MTESAEVVKLVHDAKPVVPQCPHCKYFQPGTALEPGGKCRITMTEIGREREDYTEDQSCGEAARWFKPRDEDDEPVCEPGEAEPEPEEAPKRSNVRFGLFMFVAGAASALALVMAVLK